MLKLKINIPNSEASMRQREKRTCEEAFLGDVAE